MQAKFLQEKLTVFVSPLRESSLLTPRTTVLFAEQTNKRTQEIMKTRTVLSLTVSAFHESPVGSSGCLI